MSDEIGRIVEKLKGQHQVIVSSTDLAMLLSAAFTCSKVFAIDLHMPDTGKRLADAATPALESIEPAP